jgi:hypothetical protein
MKQFSSQILIGVLTFFIGVSVVMYCYLRPNLQTPINESTLPHTQTIFDEYNSAWQTLLTFENQNIEKLNEESKNKLEQAKEVLIGKQSERARLISRISNAQGQTRYVFIEESPLMTIPGGCSLRVFIFNDEGKLLNSLAFPSGWRIGLKDIRVIYKSEIGRKIIEVESVPVINGRDIVKQYYALIGEDVLPIRLEDSGGKLVQNIYDYPNMTNGFTLKGRTEEEWKKSLESEDTAEILAALTWLNGRHLNLTQHSSIGFSEDINEARLIAEIHSSKSIKSILERLIQSSNVWIRDAVKVPVKS